MPSNDECLHQMCPSEAIYNLLALTVLQFLLWFSNLKYVGRIILNLVSPPQEEQMSADKCEHGGFQGVKEPNFFGSTSILQQGASCDHVSV